MKIDIVLSFVFGVVFLLLAMAFSLVAFFLPKPANPDMVGLFLYVMQVVLAMSASGVAAVIPGFLNVSLQQKLGNRFVIGLRAGGAIAVFVVVFLINPRSIALDQMNQRLGFDERLQACMAYVPAVDTPLPGALQYCERARDFDKSRWESYHELARIYYQYDDFEKSIENYKLAINLFSGHSFDEIVSPFDIGEPYKVEFESLCYGIAMGYLGLANTKTDIPSKIADVNRAQAALAKAIWFVTSNEQTPDQLRNQILYTIALSDAEIGISENTNDEHLQLSINRFTEYLEYAGINPQWAEFHLACLYAIVDNRSNDAGVQARARTRTKEYVKKSIDDVLATHNVNATGQARVLKCRLIDSNHCPSPRGPEALGCPQLKPIVDGDEELSSLVDKL